jgi:predicted esterase
VILISPVFDEVVLEHFGAEQVSVPIIVISGTRDDRVPIDYVRKNAATLGRLGGRIELKEWDDNHFLMFRQRQKLTETLAAWMEAQPAPTQP